MPILRLRRDGSVLMGTSPHAMAEKEDMVLSNDGKTGVIMKPDGSAITVDEAKAMLRRQMEEQRTSKIVQEEGQAISQKVLQQALQSQAKSQAVLKKMAEQAKYVAKIEAARERQQILLDQLRSLTRGLALALGIYKKDAAANLLAPTDMADEDEDCLS